MTEREYLGGMPQPTPREREWSQGMAKIIVEMVRKHDGDQDEIEAQIARELYCSVANLNAGQ